MNVALRLRKPYNRLPEPYIIHFGSITMTDIQESGISRDEAMALLKQYLKNERLISHSIASEAIMSHLAKKLGENEHDWAMAGLLHDLDYELVQEDASRHGDVAARILCEMGVSEAITDVIRKHNAEGLGLERKTAFEHALTCAETVTGMIVATALVYPDKKISSVNVKSVTKRMKTPHFARAVSRERIRECQKLGLELNEFVELSLAAMTQIADQIGL